MENIEAMLCAYVEGDLDAAGRTQIEKHLKEHPQHRKLLEELKTMREMVRTLPRAQAPMDVGESLRQKVERSMLLDSGSAPPVPTGGARGAHFFGIAAVFLLAGALCFIVIRTLSPTLKPAVFTQNTSADLAPELILPDQAQSSQNTLTAEATPSARMQMAMPKPEIQTAPTTRNSSPPIIQSLASSQNSLQQSAQTVVKTDLDAIRQRLQDSGFGIHSGQNSAAPVLMVVDSNNVSTTKAQITQFFSSNAGMSFTPVPSTSAPQSAPTTLPSGTPNVSAAIAQPPAAMNKMMVPTANPTGDLYVARGLTPQQADALRQTLTGPQNGSQVQVTVQSAQGLATTQPSAQAFSTLSPATQPSAMNSTSTVVTAATTQPTAQVQQNMFDKSASQSLVPVDAIILLRNAPSTTQPSHMSIPATQP